ncbi:uncharacterized protein LOC130891209 [Diorhabda carinulata]|uniref:uncharacterized protein LOC130891209 n=1 Tax=Diorhabda carinulata TaxID=1163345 RepID=UPI0025A27EDB|nr:uncharacterized protein LOC130891209 [Diorhabda carinulata]
MYKYIFTGFVLATLVTELYAKSFMDCPDPGKAKVTVYDNEVSTTVVGSAIKVRVPDTFFLTKPITCITVFDNEESDSVPVIEEGGVNQEYVIISIQPSITELLSFRIVVYTDV